MTIKANKKIAADMLDYQLVILHVRLTPETKDSIDKEPLMKMPKSTTLINAACPDRVHEARDAHDLNARTDFCYLSDVPAPDETDPETCMSNPW